MSAFERLPVEILHHILHAAGETSVVCLARTNQQTAVAIAECLVPYAMPWRLAYSVYLCARYAAGAHVYGIVSRFSFLHMLSRACRGCGTRTQRRVSRVPLCCRCTRNSRRRCWMVNLPIAHALGVHCIPCHKGARSTLVFAEHLQVMTGMTRRQLVLYMCLPYRGAAI